MTDAEREGLKDALKASAAGNFEGLELDTPFRWAVEDIEQPEIFFRCLPALLPASAILYFEGCTIAPDIAVLYERHAASSIEPVARDTIFPVPAIHHVAASHEMIERLCEWAASRETWAICDHFKSYCDKSLLLMFHDAFAGSLLISEHIAEANVSEFCHRLGVTYRREANLDRRDPEVIRRMLHLLDQGGEPDAASIPWWKRLSRWFGGS